jgi:hypothetical protein
MGIDKPSCRNLMALILVAGGLMFSAVPMIAHHGTAASYDQDTWVTVEGTVTEFVWRNPHSALFLEVADDDGNTFEYAIELASPGLMVRQGYTRELFNVGDTVSIEVHPSRMDTPVGECLFTCDYVVNGELVEPAQ